MMMDNIFILFYFVFFLKTKIGCYDDMDNYQFC